MERITIGCWLRLVSVDEHNSASMTNTLVELDKLFLFIGRHQVSMSASPTPPAGHIPPAFLQVIVELEQRIADTLASEKQRAKKMPAGKSKALNAMRQALKKKTKEFENVLKIYTDVSLIQLGRIRREARLMLTITEPRRLCYCVRKGQCRSQSSQGA